MKNIKIIIVLLLLAAPAAAEERVGFSIRGGLLQDAPRQKTYPDMKTGIGYIGSFGFDFYSWFGLEIGVLHSRHDYTFAEQNNAYLQNEAEKNAFYIKARFVPYRYKSFEVSLSGGPAHFDISGFQPIVLNNYVYSLDEGFSGWGGNVGTDLRFYASEGLAITFYFGVNFVRYHKYSINSADAVYSGTFPRGDSICWGLTIFHRIGIPKI